MKKLYPTVIGGRAALFAGTGFAAMALAIGAPASAQEATAADPACADTNNDGQCDEATTAEPGAIVVTGSRLRRGDKEFSEIEPITVITAQEITQAGFASSADALQSNAVTAGASQINSYYAGYVTDGGTGANTIGLRGLGPARTLVLLNGRRLAPSGTRGSVLATDLNVLPSAIVDRIEVLKAGASSIYGSDAVAGVINILTDETITGLRLDAQVTVPEIGAGIDRRIAATFGFNNDRLNVIGSVEYRKRNGIKLKDQDWFRCPIGGYLDGAGGGFGSGDYIDPATGEPKCYTLDNGGTTINTLGVPTRDAYGRLTGATGRFNRLVPDATVVGGPTPGYSGVDYYTRDSFDPAMEEEYVLTPVETYTGFLQGSYKLDMLGDAEIYGEVLATRRKSSAYLYRQLSLDYLQGSPLVEEQFRDGQFLGPNETSSGRNVAARAFIGFGLTDSSQKVDYVRASAGLRGDFFMPNWRYDFYAGKSWTDATYKADSFLTDRIANSLLVNQNLDGSFSCASAASNPGCVAAPALNADTIGGNLSDAYRDYIMDETVGTNKFRETTFAFNIDGPIFALPGGDAQLALGAEYRKQRIDDTPDQNAINGNLFGLTASEPTRGTDNVKEVFGEVYLPILADRPGFQNLSLNGSVRYTDYKSYGSDVTYKIAGEWEIVRGIGLRGSYGTSYRAPALAEQFLGATSGFLSSGTDPCDSDNFTGTQTPKDQTIAANCAAQGIDVATFQQNSSVTIYNRGGAEFGLEAETSTNWSVGAVVRPPLPQSVGTLTMSLDYFNTKVENGVSQLSGGTILDRCYSDVAFTPDTGFCRFVERDANNRLTVNSDYINLSTDIVKGWEFNSRFSTEALGGRFVLNANVTKYDEQASKLFPDEYITDANGITTVPEWVGNFDATYEVSGVTFRYGLDWTDASKGTYDYIAYDETTGTVDQDTSDYYKSVYDFEVGDYFLHSASVQFDVAEKFQITMGVRNLTNRKPPRISADYFSLVGNAPLYSGYDYTGRTFFANTSFKF